MSPRIRSQRQFARTARHMIAHSFEMASDTFFFVIKSKFDGEFEGMGQGEFDSKGGGGGQNESESKVEGKFKSEVEGEIEEFDG